MARCVVAVAWAALCLAVAASAAIQMLVTFAPTPGREGDAASAELAGLERAREFWSGGVWLASALLAASGVAVAVLAWRGVTTRPPPATVELDDRRPETTE